MISYKGYKFTFFEDPGHAWLAVPKKLIESFGIQKEISSCSYIYKDTVYLEEDCDARIFLKKYMEVYGETAKWDEVYQESTPIRGYKYYDGV